MGTICRLSLAAVVALASGLTAHGQCDGPIYPVQFVNDRPGDSVALGDVDGDGDLDAALGCATDANLAGMTAGRVQIYLNNGAGYFTPGQTLEGYDLHQSHYSKASFGDLDGDGNLDLVISNATDTWSDGYLYIALNQGDGTFSVTDTYHMDAYPGLPLCVDLDGDGDVDIATPNTQEESVSVLLNDGTGQFPTVHLVSVGEDPNRIMAGDVNEDGYIDLVVSCTVADREVWLLFGAGDGTFPTSSTLPVPDLWAALLHELDGDGHLDLAVATRVTGAPDVVTVLSGQGDGTFIEGASVDLPIYATWLQAADFDGDSQVDLAASSTGGEHDYITILLGGGDGTFQLGGSYFAGGDPGRFVVGDVDGDAAPDVLANAMLAPTVLRNDGQGALQTNDLHIFTGLLSQVDAADLDGDGDQDVVVGGTTSSGMVGAYLNDGNGDLAFQVPVQPFGASPRALSTCELNGDGSPDVALIDYQTSVLTAFGNGDGTFAAPNTYNTVSSPFALLAGDLNNDALDDLVVYRFQAPHVSILLNPGDGTFNTVSSTISTDAQPYDLADVNDDGDLDLVMGYGSDATIALNNGDGTFAAPISYALDSYPAAVCSMAAGDVDDDGDVDVLAGRYREDPYWYTYEFYFSLLRNQGDGTFAAEPRLQVQVDVRTTVRFDDLDGDGDQDIYLTHDADAGSRSQAGGPIIFYNDGSGSFGSPDRYVTHLGTRTTLAVDLDGNGTLDIVGVNVFNDQSVHESSVAVLFNECAAACIGDLDGDGDTDQADLGALLGAYNNDDGGDLNGDGFTDQADLGILLGDYNCGE
jgi:FG-GAP-like repeat